MQGDYPIHEPYSHQLADKLVAEAHQNALHGGVGLTMAKVRERYLVSSLRRLTKKVVKNCHGCKRFNAQAFAVPPPGQLPKGQSAFQVTGVDLQDHKSIGGGRIVKERRRSRFTPASLTRGIYLDLLSIV